MPPAASILPGAEEVAFDTADGLRLGGWFVPGARGPGPAVLVCNGNGGTGPCGRRWPPRWRMGLAVLLFDYRGYGGNPGEPD